MLLGLWRGWRPIYTVQHVRALSRQLHAYLHMPFRIALLTDQALKAEECEVDVVAAIPGDPVVVHARRNVNCYRRLRYFDPAFTERFGTPWVVSMDLDTLLLDDITPILEYAMNDFGFCILRGRLAERQGQRPYNGAFYAIRVGAHRHVWDDFDWVEGPQECRQAGWTGSDQVWLSLKLRGAPTVGRELGAYFVGEYQESSDDEPEPRMLNYAGMTKPWSKTSRRESPELWEEWCRWA